jgi:hypothetical protein
MAISNKKTLDGDSRAARRLAKARVPQEYRDHLVEMDTETEELASWFDYDDDFEFAVGPCGDGFFFLEEEFAYLDSDF